jgi:hypothetical protein
VRGLVEVGTSPVQSWPEPVGHPRAGQWRDELGLPARTVRGRHEAPGQSVRGGGTVIAMNEV